MAITVMIPTTPDREDQLARCIAAVKASDCSERIDIMYERNNYEGFVKPVLRMLKQVRGLCFIIGNDCVVRRDAIQLLYNAYIKQFPKDDGIVAPYDEVPNVPRLPSHPFGHSRTLLANIYPRYFHNFVDKDLGQVMWRKGKLLMVPQAVVEHHHWSRRKSEKDTTYTVGEASSDADGEVYFHREQRGFDLKPEEVVVDLSKYPKGPF